jgi:hypothetical protein
MVERFRLMMRIYTDPDGNMAVMSDIDATTDLMRRWPLMAPCAPALHFAALMGKHGPWKLSLGKAWGNTFKIGVQKSVANSSLLSLRSLQFVESDELTMDDLCVMVKILQAASIEAQEDEHLAHWEQHVGFRNSWHSGFRQFVGPRLAGHLG